MTKFNNLSENDCDQTLLSENYQLAFMSEAIFRDYDTNKDQYLVTIGVASCIAVIIRDIKSKFSILAHIGPDCNAEQTQQQLLDICYARNIPTNQLEVTLLGGWKSHHASLRTTNEINAFWQEKTLHSLDTTHLFFCDCIDLPNNEILSLINTLLEKKFGRDCFKNYITDVVNPSGGMLYASGRKDEVSKYIEKIINTYIIKKIRGFTETDTKNFPLLMVKCIKDTTALAEQKVVAQFLGHPRCVFPFIRFDTETGEIAFLQHPLAYHQVPKILQDSLGQLHLARCERNCEILEIKTEKMRLTKKSVASGAPNLFDSSWNSNQLALLKKCIPKGSSEIPQPGKAFRIVANDGNAEILEELCKAFSSQIDEKDANIEKGYTALRLAVEKRHYKCVRILLTHGASLECIDAKGISIREIINMSRDQQLLQLLEELSPSLTRRY